MECKKVVKIIYIGTTQYLFIELCSINDFMQFGINSDVELNPRLALTVMYSIRVCY